MSVEAILAALQAAGVRVVACPERGTLYLEPTARLTPELIARVRAHKPALMALLTARRLGWPTERIADAMRALDEEDAIVEMTREYVSVLRRRPRLVRFYRHT